MPMHLILPILFASAQQLEDLNALDAQLAVASGNRATPLDQRLRLARCPTPVRIDPAPQNTLMVRCPETGWQVRVAIKTAVTVEGPATPVMIQRGETVRVSITSTQFTVSYTATAMEAGHKGDAVRVKFPSGGKVLVATVTGQGRAEILD